MKIDEAFRDAQDALNGHEMGVPLPPALENMCRALLALRPVVEAARKVRRGHYSIKTKMERKDRALFDEFNMVVDQFEHGGTP